MLWQNTCARQTPAGVWLECREPHKAEGAAGLHIANLKRGTIKGFTAEARKRLLTVVSRLPEDVHYRVVTLTLPGYFRPWDSPEEQARLIAAFRKRVMRAFPGSFGVWRKEWQERGAAHWHILIGRAKGMSMKWVAQNWNAIVDPTDKAHLRAGTQVEFVRSRNGVVRYMAKELGKTVQTMEVDRMVYWYGTSGRSWAFWGDRTVLAAMKLLAIPADQWSRLVEELDAYVRSRRKVKSPWMLHWTIGLVLTEDATGWWSFVEV